MPEPPARKLGGTRIPPFWRRIPWLFLYPLAPRPLGLLLLLALGSAAPLFVPGLVASLPPSPRSFGLWLLLLWIPLLAYGQCVLERTATGMLSAREAGSTPCRPWKHVPIVLLALLVVWAVFVLVGAGAGYLAGGTLLLVLPASIMSPTRTGSVLGPLDPVALLTLARSIGWPYLGLCGTLMTLVLAADAAAAAVSLALPRSLWVYPATSFLGMYLTLVMYHMMGYVLHQVHDRLGRHPRPPSFHGDQPRAWLRDPAALDAHLQQLTAEGRVDHAVALLAGLIRREPRNLALHERYDRALRLAGNGDAWKRHASEYLGLLLREGHSALALGYYDQTRRADAGFRAHDAATLVELARAARAHGRTELASELLLDFGQRFPDSTAQTEATYLAAQLLHEDLGETEEARKLLEHLVRTDPGDPLAIAAKRYLQVLTRRLRR